MYPRERSLVTQLKDMPFALIGVNSDQDLEWVQGIIEQEAINWRSFQDRGGIGDPISKQWGVSIWPTVFIIDAEGVIRHSGQEGYGLVIQELLAEMGHAVEIE
jgi:hypothetical protein